MEETTNHVRRCLLSELVDSIDDVLERIYEAKPRLRPAKIGPAETDSEPPDTVESATVKTQQLIDRCYQVREQRTKRYGNFDGGVAAKSRVARFENKVE